MGKKGRILKAFLNYCNQIMRNTLLQMNNHVACLKKILQKCLSLTILKYNRDLSDDVEKNVNIKATLSLLNQISGVHC